MPHNTTYGTCHSARQHPSWIESTETVCRQVWLTSNNDQ
jgi:hypothetical protein